MTGVRLAVGLVVMGLVVPLALWILLPLETLREVSIVAITCFLFWGVADLLAKILSRPRLEDRSPTKAFREWGSTKQAGGTEPPQGPGVGR